MSTLAFAIAQFFLLLNHQLLSFILNKASFNPKIFCFFSNYLISRKTQYLWNDFVSPFFSVDVDVEQGSILSPILLALYILLIFHIFEKKIKKSQYSYLISFFIDNRLFILQEKYFEKTNAFLFSISLISL